jgi:DNA-binding response OmpR family regulator
MEQLSSSHCQPEPEPWIFVPPTPMIKNLLLIGSLPDSLWVEALRGGLESAADLNVVPGDKARERLAERAYDLIILDYSAEGVALQTLRELRQLRPDTPVLVVSASPTWQQAREVFAAGGIDYVPKSLNAKALRELMEEILSR